MCYRYGVVLRFGFVCTILPSRSWELDWRGLQSWEFGRGRDSGCECLVGGLGLSLWLTYSY
jgi:hypothetical protein